jgi:hypothetical protein
MRLRLPHRRQTQKGHEAKFSIIQILRDEIDKKLINEIIKKQNK